ncbi:hypothetical protein [Sporosarcina sp. FSL W7-1283]|uniref:hypothetical protein n=1 Tax=Sporosarcina sp. FSL W7-1283 TaxID=2921560 RepID=UPI0030F7DA0F
MNIELSAEDVDYAVEIYLAIKGYRSDARHYSTCGKTGGTTVKCTNVKLGEVKSIDEIVELVKSR